MTIIYFIRHGEYKNPNNIVPWRLPHFPLSDEGIKNINKDADYFKDKKIEVIYSSPILRAKQSANILGKRLNKKVIISKSIIEVYTPFQFKNLSYVKFNNNDKYPFLEDFHINNHGESITKTFTRVNGFVKKILTKHRDNNVILVSHGDPIMIYIAIKKGTKLTGSKRELEKNYIPKSGIIKVNIKTNKIINIESINY